MHIKNYEFNYKPVYEKRVYYNDQKLFKIIYAVK